MLVMLVSTAKIMAIAAVSAALLSSCTGTRDRPNIALPGLTPLVIPPDFALKPPQKGEAQAAKGALQQETLDVVLGGPSPRSEIERDILARAGEASVGIRSEIGDNVTHSVAKGLITQRILSAPAGNGRVAQVYAGVPRSES